MAKTEALSVRVTPATEKAVATAAKDDHHSAASLVEKNRYGVAVEQRLFERVVSVVPSHINDPKHWRDRAAEARVKAEHMTSVFKKTMVRVAADYERLAKRAEDRNSPEALAAVKNWPRRSG